MIRSHWKQWVFGNGPDEISNCRHSPQVINCHRTMTQSRLFLGRTSTPIYFPFGNFIPLTWKFSKLHLKISNSWWWKNKLDIFWIKITLATLNISCILQYFFSSIYRSTSSWFLTNFANYQFSWTKTLHENG